MSSQFTLSTEDSSPTHARFILEPLPQGFGHTLGNSLRRVLYTSIPGAALTSVAITGVTHQFAVIDGIQEDVVQIILNLKQIRVGYRGSDPVKIRLSAKDRSTVTAKDFILPPNVTIANPDQVIAHLTDKNAKLELEATVESGLGYSPAEDREITTIGVVPLDATYTPVTRVNFSVAATRVGRVTNFDKLILDVTTDGTVTPQTALTSASQTLMDYFSAIVSPQTPSDTPSSTSAGNPLTSSSSPLTLSSIEELDLPTRIANALQKAGFETISQLQAIPRADLAKVKNLGTKSVKIIELALKDRGLELKS